MDNRTTEAPPLRVAIVGGSIGGCTLANALLHQKHIEFDVYESKETFSERGAAIAMHTNALAAFRAMGIDADRILSDAQAVKRDVLQTIVGCGEHAGQEFLETIEGPWGVGRQQLLEELIEPLPENRLHCNKKLISIDEKPAGPLLLHFSDGTTSSADAVVGSDGYRSQIRQMVLGATNPASTPQFAGFWDARALLPIDQAISRLGTTLIDPRKQQLTAVAGNGTFTLSGPINEGKMFFLTVSGSAPPGWDSTVWKSPINRSHIERAFEGWDLQFRAGAIDAVMENGPGVTFNQWESKPCSTYFRGRICMMGDAAHATSNWLGQGAAMAIEDCAVLSALFEKVRISEEVEVAFRAFDQVRRGGGRAGMVIEQSRLLGQILTGQKGLEPEVVRGYGIQAKREEIRFFDVMEQVREAQGHFGELSKEADRR